MLFNAYFIFCALYAVLTFYFYTILPFPFHTRYILFICSLHSTSLNHPILAPFLLLLILLRLLHFPQLIKDDRKLMVAYQMLLMASQTPGVKQTNKVVCGIQVFNDTFILMFPHDFVKIFLKWLKIIIFFIFFKGIVSLIIFILTPYRVTWPSYSIAISLQRWQFSC